MALTKYVDENKPSHKFRFLEGVVMGIALEFVAREFPDMGLLSTFDSIPEFIEYGVFPPVMGVAISHLSDYIHDLKRADARESVIVAGGVIVGQSIYNVAKYLL